MRALPAFLAACGLVCVTSFVTMAQEPSRPVRFATDAAFAPFSYTQSNGKIIGFEVDVYEKLCQTMKLTCTIENLSFDSLIPSLQAGKFDAIISALSVTPSRSHIVSFSLPYADDGDTFMVVESRFKSLPGSGSVISLNNPRTQIDNELTPLKQSLRGKKIGVQISTSSASFLKTYLAGDVEIRFYRSSEMLNLDLLAGRVDAIFASTAYLINLAALENKTKLLVTGPLFKGGMLGEGFAIAFRQSDPALKAKFDAAIKEAVKDGTIAELSKKYFTYDVTPH